MSEILKNYRGMLKQFEDYLFSEHKKHFRFEIVQVDYEAIDENRLLAKYLIKLYNPLYPMIKEKYGVIFTYRIELPESKDRFKYALVKEEKFENFEDAVKKFKEEISVEV